MASTAGAAAGRPAAAGPGSSWQVCSRAGDDAASSHPSASRLSYRVRGTPTALVRSVAGSPSVEMPELTDPLLQEDELRAWQDQVARGLLLASGAVSAGVIAYFLPAMVRTGAWSAIGYALASLVVNFCLALVRRAPYWARAGFLSVTPLLAAGFIFFSDGDRAAGMAYLFMAVSMSVLFFGLRMGVGALVAALAILGVCAAGYAQGWLPALVVVPFRQNNPASWLGTAVAIAGSTAAVCGAVYILLRKLRRELTARSALVADLQREARAREDALERLRHTQNQLVEAQRLQTVAALAGGLAHDMNNALTVILGEAELWEEDPAQSAAQIREAASHAAQLTRQLLSLGRRDVVQPRPIDLRTTVDTAIKAVRRALPSEIVAKVAVSGAPLVVLADPNQIHQVVYNLALNARDAMVGGGTLQIEVAAGEGETALLRVRDTGVGIAPDVLPKIFDAFFTTKPRGRGTGLGLATARQVVETLGGTIAVDSAAGAGTTFTVTLPLGGDDEDEAAPAALPGSKVG
jgi:signal transduction histidine kinase